MNPNFVNHTIWTGDCLDIMRGMNSECVSLIYLDPPFNSNANYAAPIGSEAAGAAFKDTWSLADVDVAWVNLIASKHPALHRVLLAAMNDSDKSYLVYMAARLLECKRVLRLDGSIYLHCDPTMSHYLKLLMDAIFGRQNYRNEIVWCYRGPGSPKMRQFNRKHDIIHWYSKGDTWIFNADAVRLRHHEKTRANYKEGLSGSGHADTPLRSGKVPESWWAEEKGNGLAITPKQKIQYVGYPTQKPLALLERIVQASSNPGDMVLDPFCGCATTLVAADRLDRQWAGIDLSSIAGELVLRRIRDDRGPLFDDVVHRTDIPKRTDLGKLPPANSAANKKLLYGEQAGNCEGCGQHFQVQNLEVDHIIAKSKGGTDHLANLQLLCGSCNKIKGNRGMEYLKAKLQLA